MIETVTSDMRDVLGLRGAPVLTRVFRWPGGTPQLEVGHLERMREVEQAFAAVPGLFLTGAGVRSTGIPDSVADGTRAGEAAAFSTHEPRDTPGRAPRGRAGRRGGAGLGQRHGRLGRVRAGVPLALRLVAALAPGARERRLRQRLPDRRRTHPDERPRDRRRAPGAGAPARPGESVRGDGRGGRQRLRPGRAAGRRPGLRAGPASAALRRRCRAPARASTPTASRSAARTSRPPPASSRASSRAATCTAAPTRTSWSRRTPRSTRATAAGRWCRTARSWASRSRASRAPTTWASSSRSRSCVTSSPTCEDGRYDGFPDSGLQTAPLLSPAYRRERGLPQGRSGVVVDRVAPGGTADGVVRAGDVLLSAQGHEIADDGTIRVGDARVTFEHAIDMLQVGETDALRRVARRQGARARRRPRAASRATTATATATRWRPTTWCTPGSCSCGSRWSC